LSMAMSEALETAPEPSPPDPDAPFKGCSTAARALGSAPTKIDFGLHCITYSATTKMTYYSAGR
jgi:hypothetical protein